MQRYVFWDGSWLTVNFDNIEKFTIYNIKLRTFLFRFRTVQGISANSGTCIIIISKTSITVAHLIVPEDPVYMEDPEWRDEYVLNDTGKVYTGNYKQVRSNKCI